MGTITAAHHSGGPLATGLPPFFLVAYGVTAAIILILTGAASAAVITPNDMAAWHDDFTGKDVENHHTL